MKKIITLILNFLGITSAFSQKTPQQMNDNYTTNLKYLPEIVAYMEHPDLHWQQIIETSSKFFKSDIVVEYLQYPYSFESDNPKENKENLKKIKAKNIFKPYEKTFLKPINIDFLSDEDKKNGGQHILLLVYFEIPPFAEAKGILKTQSLNFYLIPWFYEDGKMKVTVFYNAFPYYSHFENITNAKMLTEDTQDEKEQLYLSVFSEAIEVICNEFKIATEKNKGQFVTPEKEDPEKLLDEFIEITHAKDFNDEEQVLEFKHNWNLIQKNPEEYKEILVDEGYFDEDAEIDTHYFIQYLLSEFLCAFDTDWKMDHEELSEFISEEIGQDFKITYEETKQKASVIVEKIEKESNYTMLNIDTQIDSYSFFICKKSDKDKILELARKLNFPIEDTF